MRRPRAHTLPELLVTSAIVLLLFGLVAVVLSIASRSHERMDARVDLQLEAQDWLNRVGDDVAAGARHRLFPDRCEIDVFGRSELLRFGEDFRYDAAAREAVIELDAPLGTPEAGWETALAAFNFDKGETLEARQEGPNRVRLRFRTAPTEGDRILVEYPVNHLLVYWREPDTGLLRRELRDSLGATRVEVLNPPDRRPAIRCERLQFAEPTTEVVRITVRALGPTGQSWQDSLDVSTAR